MKKRVNLVKKLEYGPHYKLSKKFVIPVATHAVEKEETFLSILKEGKILLPSQIKDVKKMTPYMEKVLGIHNCVYLGLGFIYNTSHQKWPFSFIFRKSILRKPYVTTFNCYLISKAWMRFLKKMREEDISFLHDIQKKSPKAREVIQDLIDKDICNWWEIEPELVKAFNKYKYKKEYIKKIREIRDEAVLSRSYAPHYLAKNHLPHPNIKKFEAVSRKNISLNSPEFIGLYIHPSKAKKLIPLIKKYLPKGKLIYTGKKIIRI